MSDHLVSESAMKSGSSKYQVFGRVQRALASIGPGFVYLLTILGAGDIVSNATAGASYGYQLIWALGLTLIFRFIWVNISAGDRRKSINRLWSIGLLVPFVFLVDLNSYSSYG